MTLKSGSIINYPWIQCSWKQHKIKNYFAKGTQCIDLFSNASFCNDWPIRQGFFEAWKWYDIIYIVSYIMFIFIVSIPEIDLLCNTSTDSAMIDSLCSAFLQCIIYAWKWVNFELSTSLDIFFEAWPYNFWGYNFC